MGAGYIQMFDKCMVRHYSGDQVERRIQTCFFSIDVYEFEVPLFIQKLHIEVDSNVIGTCW